MVSISKFVLGLIQIQIYFVNNLLILTKFPYLIKFAAESYEPISIWAMCLFLLFILHKTLSVHSLFKGKEPALVI
jgi:hypothetical protein